MLLDCPGRGSHRPLNSGGSCRWRRRGAAGDCCGAAERLAPACGGCLECSESPCYSPCLQTASRVLDTCCPLHGGGDGGAHRNAMANNARFGGLIALSDAICRRNQGFHRPPWQKPALCELPPRFVQSRQEQGDPHQPAATHVEHRPTASNLNSVDLVHAVCHGLAARTVPSREG